MLFISVRCQLLAHSLLFIYFPLYPRQLSTGRKAQAMGERLRGHWRQAGKFGRGRWSDPSPASRRCDADHVHIIRLLCPQPSKNSKKRNHTTPKKRVRGHVQTNRCSAPHPYGLPQVLLVNAHVVHHVPLPLWSCRARSQPQQLGHTREKGEIIAPI